MTTQVSTGCGGDIRSVGTEEAHDAVRWRKPEARMSDRAIDEELVKTLQARDHSAWNSFLRSWFFQFERAVVFAYLKFAGSVPNREMLREATMDSQRRFYEVFLQKFKGFEGRAKFRSFVFSVVYFSVLEGIREDKRLWRDLSYPEPFGFGDLVCSAPGSEPDEESRGLQARALRKCVVSLSPKKRAVVVLHHLKCNKLTLRKVAALFAESLSAVEKRHQRALCDLKKCIQKRLSEQGDL